MSDPPGPFAPGAPGRPPTWSSTTTSNVLCLGGRVIGPESAIEAEAQTTG